MVIKTSKGFYEVLKNVREALNIEKFEEAYLEEYFDSYEYIVGDIASEILRLKGFNKADGSFNKIPEYLAESCVFKCGFFILRRINEAEYNKLLAYYKDHPNKNLSIGDDHVETMEKINYNKEGLVLESTSPIKPNIVLDMNRINKVKTFPLPADLKDDKEDIREYRRDNRVKDKNNNSNQLNKQNNNSNNNKEFKKNNNQQRPQQNNKDRGQNKMNNNSFKNNNHHKNKIKGGASNGQ